MTDGKLPPTNIEAEEAVLGSILVVPSILDDVQAIVQPKDFYREKNAWIYEAMLRTAPDCNQLNVGQELARSGRLEAIGGRGVLSLLSGRCENPYDAEGHAGTVARLALYRRYITAAGHIAAIAYEAGSDISEAYGKIRTIIDNLAPEGGGDLMSPTQHAELVLKIASDWKEHKEVVQFGYASLDKLTGGMVGGDFAVVGARAGVGKSQVLQEVALHNGYRQKCVLFASAEMPKEQLTEREIAMATHKSIVELRRGTASKKDWEAIGQLADAMSTMPLYVLSGSVTLQRVSRRAKALKQSQGLSLICFDHIQIVARKLGRDSGDTLREKVGYVTAFLKSLALELDVPILTACQLSRQVEAREGHAPMLSDLQESGSIEQDADMVLLLHRPDMYPKCKEDERGLLYVRLAKHRQGGIETAIKLRWFPELRRYGSPQREEDHDDRRG